MSKELFNEQREMEVQRGTINLLDSLYRYFDFTDLDRIQGRKNEGQGKPDLQGSVLPETHIKETVK